MEGASIPSPAERLQEFQRRLARVPLFDGFQSAWDGLARVLDEVEDELTGIPKNPDTSKEAPPDGRMYPPFHKREVASGLSGVRSFRQRKHWTSFSENGAIEICELDKNGRPVLPPFFQKAGADGRNISDYRRSPDEQDQTTAK